MPLEMRLQSPPPHDRGNQPLDTYRSALERADFKQKVFQIVIDHLEKGTEREELEARLRLLCKNSKFGQKSAVAIFQDTRIENKQDEVNLNRIVALLFPYHNIKFQNFVDSPTNFYDWIKWFSKHACGHRHLEDLNHLLQQIHPTNYRPWLWLTLTVLTAGIGAYLYFVPAHFLKIEAWFFKIMPIVLDFLQTTFSILKNIPLLLVLFNVISIPLQAFRTYNDNFRSPGRRFQKWLIGTLPPLIGILGYFVVYTAKGVFTPLAAGLFISSALIDVVNSLYNLFLCLSALPNKKENLTFNESVYYFFDKLFNPNEYLELLKETRPLDTLEKKLDFIRQQERIHRTLKTVLVNLLAASVIAIIVTLWSIFPPSLPLMITFILLINLTGYTRSASLSYIHSNSVSHLQESLHKTYLFESHDKAISNLSESESPISTNPSIGFFSAANADDGDRSNEVLVPTRARAQSYP